MQNLPTSTLAVDIPAKGQVVVVERPLPELTAGQVLVRVTGCGFCGGDIERYLGKADFSSPFQLGHEIAGHVVAMGPVIEQADLWYPFGPDVPKVGVGDLVTGWIIGGGMAGYVVAESRNLRLVPPVGLQHPEIHGEPLMCCVNAVRKTPPPLGGTVVIIGAGFMALVIAKLARIAGAAHVIVVARRRTALDRALEWGATHVIPSGAGDLATSVRAITGGRLAHVVYEVTGAQGGLDLAYAVADQNRWVVGVGFHQHGLRTVDLGNQAIEGQQFASAHYRELFNLWAGLEQGLDLTGAGMLQLDGLVTHPVGLDDVADVFATAAARGDKYVKATVKLAV